MGQMFLMHAYSLVSLVSTCNATVNGECVANGVVRFLVCCATFALSVGLLLFNESFFFGPCLFERLVTNFSFDLSLRKFRFESTTSFFLCLMIFFQRLVTNFSFEPSLRKFKFEYTFFSFFMMIFFIHVYDVLKRVSTFVWVSVRV